SGSTGMMLEGRHDRANYEHDRAANVRRFVATGRCWPWSRLVHFKPYAWPNAWYQRLGLLPPWGGPPRLPAREALPAPLRPPPQSPGRLSDAAARPAAVAQRRRDDPAAAHAARGVHRIRVDDARHPRTARRRLRSARLRRVLRLRDAAHRLRLPGTRAACR